MPFNINDFKSDGLIYGGARPSLFDVEITFGDLTSELSRLQFLARASQIPAMTLGDVEVPYFGRKIKVAGDRTFSDWSVTIMNDEDFKLRAAFESWSNRLNTIESNVNSAGSRPANYKGEAIVRQYSKAGKSGPTVSKPIRSYKFVGIFPTQIDAINLDWDSTNQIETFDVTFSYDYWVVDENNTNALPYAPDSVGIGFQSR